MRHWDLQRSSQRKFLRTGAPVANVWKKRGSILECKRLDTHQGNELGLHGADDRLRWSPAKPQIFRWREVPGVLLQYPLPFSIAQMLTFHWTVKLSIVFAYFWTHQHTIFAWRKWIAFRDTFLWMKKAQTVRCLFSCRNGKPFPHCEIKPTFSNIRNFRSSSLFLPLKKALVSNKQSPSFLLQQAIYFCR